jgi:hypothetical protein
MEGLRRGARRCRWQSGQGAQGAGRAAGLCLRRLAPDGPGVRGSGQARTGARLESQGQEAVRTVQRSLLGRGGRLLRLLLDGEKRKIMSVASNPGHCLWSGIVPPDRAKRVVDRLMAPDMFRAAGASAPFPPATRPSIPIPTRTARSGRTTTASSRTDFGATASTPRPSASPGTSAVRPAIFMITRCPSSIRACSGTPPTFRSSTWAPTCRRPGPPARASRFCEMILGFQPDAPAGKLYLDPALPDWLPDIDILDLRVGAAVFDLAFRRDGEANADGGHPGRPQGRHPPKLRDDDRSLALSHRGCGPPLFNNRGFALRWAP